jgi:hypothetical protein
MLSRVKYAGLLLVLVLFSLSTGCLSLGKSPGNDQVLAQNTPPASGSMEDITSRNPPKVSLESAMASLPVAEQEGDIDMGGMALHQVWGFGVDSSGLAKTWVLGMQGEGKNSLLTYSEGEWRGLDMDVSLPQEEVKMNELVSPQALFRNGKNADRIVREMNRLKTNECDLSLGGGTYLIIVHSATESSPISFNAKTGEMTSSA